ncbi:hypothetical protein [Thalassorhabdus alkalitolerans]|uniref:hypothetical protein n=1 Tax=Thalassorhabdus alkalitolerans TaxID=2282697 RepID=UPI0036DB1E5B
MSQEDREKWLERYGKPIEAVRTSVMEEKASQDVEVSNFKLKHFMLQKGYPYKDAQEADKASMPHLKKAVIQAKRAGAEVSFASGAVLEGMFDLFGKEQHKALEKYQQRMHVIETEKGAYIGQVTPGGKLNSLSHFMEKEDAKKQLQEFREMQKERGQEREFVREIGERKK